MSISGGGGSPLPFTTPQDACDPGMECVGGACTLGSVGYLPIPGRVVCYPIGSAQVYPLVPCPAVPPPHTGP